MERRRHPRQRREVGSVVVRCGAACSVIDTADVIDVSVGGIFVTMAPLPLLSTVTVEVAGLRVMGRVVRVRLDGRRRGQPIRPAVAIAFVEPHPEEWSRLVASPLSA
jgi:hypothetical protein